MAISKQNAKRAGKQFEWSVRATLTEDGYRVIMSAGSMTACDMVAIKPGEILFIQCKAGVAGTGTPGLISPAERGELHWLAHCLRAPLAIAARAIVAYQVKNGRAHITLYKELTGTAPDAAQPWWPDQVVGDG